MDTKFSIKFDKLCPINRFEDDWEEEEGGEGWGGGGGA